MLVDDRPVGRIDQYREGEGYSVYQLDSTEFEELILTAAEGG